MLLTLYLQVVRCFSSSFISTNNLAGVAHHHDMINMESHVSWWVSLEEGLQTKLVLLLSNLGFAGLAQHHDMLLLQFFCVMVIEATRRSCKPSYAYFYSTNLGFAGSRSAHHNELYFIDSFPLLWWKVLTRCDDILLLELNLLCSLLILGFSSRPCLIGLCLMLYLFCHLNLDYLSLLSWLSSITKKGEIVSFMAIDAHNMRGLTASLWKD